ncbi:unnamed protein product [Cuscuta europaea]|uniref:Uncharacterized protein n=1 Tax=Cuscuta europaea TaxID=41803 RepID=A0A9P1E7J9_CUSEU|nr:unnamed protein product [Cuscuta europaea]
MDTASLIENKNNEASIMKSKDEGRKKWSGKSNSDQQFQNWKDVNKWKSNPNTSAISGKGASERKPVDEMIQPNQKRTGPRFSQSELTERSRKGLCFKCGENWNRGHVCKMKNYKMILVEKSEGENESREELIDSEEEKDAHQQLKTMQLSVLSKEDIASMKTFKVRGVLKWAGGEKLVYILIDSGATHNFIAHSLIDRWQIPFTPIQGYKVQIGNGNFIPNKGKCTGMQLEVQGTLIQQTFYMLELGVTDMVLGLEWLTELGNMDFNFQDKVIKWRKQGQIYMIKGETTLNNMEVSMKTMAHILQQTGDGFLLYSEGEMNTLEQKGEEEWERVVAEFPEVFTAQLKFPPARGCDNAINIKEGANIPNLRPYMYSFDQKNERENH